MYLDNKDIGGAPQNIYAYFILRNFMLFSGVLLYIYFGVDFLWDEAFRLLLYCLEEILFGRK